MKLPQGLFLNRWFELWCHCIDLPPCSPRSVGWTLRWTLSWWRWRRASWPAAAWNHTDHLLCLQSSNTVAWLPWRLRPPTANNTPSSSSSQVKRRTESHSNIHHEKSLNLEITGLEHVDVMLLCHLIVHIVYYKLLVVSLSHVQSLDSSTKWFCLIRVCMLLRRFRSSHNLSRSKASSSPPPR